MPSFTNMHLRWPAECCHFLRENGREFVSIPHVNKLDDKNWSVWVGGWGDLCCYSNLFICVFQAAKRAGWLPPNSNSYPKTSHVGFGLVLGSDGKRFRTRSSEIVRLVDLLDEAKSRSKTELTQRLENNGTEITSFVFHHCHLLHSFKKCLPFVAALCIFFFFISRLSS